MPIRYSALDGHSRTTATDHTGLQAQAELQRGSVVASLSSREQQQQQQQVQRRSSLAGLKKSELKREAKAAGISHDALDEVEGDLEYPAFKDAWIRLILDAEEEKMCEAAAKKGVDLEGKQIDENAELTDEDRYRLQESPTWFEHKVFAEISDNPLVFLPIYALLYVAPVLTCWGSVME